MKGPVYVGSVQYDTEDGKTADQYAYGLNQEYLIETEYERNNIRLPCGTISNGAQCLCDICINTF